MLNAECSLRGLTIQRGDGSTTSVKLIGEESVG